MIQEMNGECSLLIGIVLQSLNQRLMMMRTKSAPTPILHIVRDFEGVQIS